MMTTWRRGRALLITAAWMAAAAAHAQDNAYVLVDYGPLSDGVSAVPTLSEWMLLGTGLLLALVAWRALRSRVNGRLLSNLVLVGAAAVLSWWGAPLVGKAMAASYPTVSMTSPSGGTVTVKQLSQITNATGVSQVIRAIRPVYGAIAIPPADATQRPVCSVGLVMAPAGVCFLGVDTP